ncbi:MAG: hypothetical protein A2Z25_01140 [Planctomycetes bacterium RBG_16_55_9]|nr:MAG: hypothetical protein A2Z25_01140 [Planctomycetes bacterium RBG_16_55_9]
MGILPMSITSVSPVKTGPGRAWESWAGRPCYETPYGVTTSASFTNHHSSATLFGSWIMKRLFLTVLILRVALAPACTKAQATRSDRNAEWDLQIVLQLQLGEPVGQLHAVPVNLGGL